jgi:hypothetical protein
MNEKNVFSRRRETIIQDRRWSVPTCARERTRKKTIFFQLGEITLSRNIPYDREEKRTTHGAEKE